MDMVVEWDVPDIEDKPRPALRVGDSGKITVDLRPVDLPVSESVYANRSDFLCAPVRNWIARHVDVTRQAVARKHVEFGLRHDGRRDLEAHRDAGTTLDIRVLALARIAADVSPELARETIASIEVMGSLQQSSAVKAALADRLR